jgi:hypothetical protein
MKSSKPALDNRKVRKDAAKIRKENTLGIFAVKYFGCGKVGSHELCRFR